MTGKKVGARQEREKPRSLQIHQRQIRSYGEKVMKKTCPKCGEKVVLNGLGRKCLGISVKNIYDALHACQNVELAARELGCSRGYIYQELKKKGLKPKDVIFSKT